MDSMFVEATTFQKRYCTGVAGNSKTGITRACPKSSGGPVSGSCSDGPEGPIGEWDVSKVRDMDNIFDGATSFDGDISKWEVSAVTSMSRMFQGASLFNSDLSKWDVSNVITMESMFMKATIFNSDISRWVVSRVTDMRKMFQDAVNFNRDLSNWDTSSVTKMTAVFANAKSFNGDVSRWYVSKVDDMTSMFSGALKFNGDVSKWDVSNVKKMDFMFYYAQSFVQTLCSAAWVHSKAAETADMMLEASSGSISKTVGSCEKRSSNSNTGFRFTSRKELKRAIDQCVKTIQRDGSCSTTQHGPIADWDVSMVTDMSGLFHDLKVFNGDISNWDVSNVTNMFHMFWGASQFNSDISRWRVSRVTNMEGLFRDATDFNGDLSNWDVSSVTTMESMFRGAASFNGDISNWVVSRVTDMKRMFMFAKFFNRDMSKWDVSSVTNMQGMFLQASSFNNDISKWDVSSVKDMQGMFLQASSFNTDISKWDIRSVTDTDYMFYQAESFKQKLCGESWIDSKATNKFMFASSEGSLADKPCSFVRPIYNDVGRELVRRPGSTSPANANECPKCGKFGKSGRVSCCAPGGAWYKKCGSAKNKNVQYKWSQGTDACKKKPRTTTAAISACAVCGSVKKSRKKSCCGRGGSWYRNCGTAGNKRNKKFGHTWFEGIQVCKKQRAQHVAAFGAFESSAADDQPLSDILKQLKVSTVASLNTTTDSTSTDVLTTAPAPTRALTSTSKTPATARTATIAAKITHSVKETPMSTTDFVENDEFF